MKLIFILLLFPFFLFPSQVCKIKIDSVLSNINANDITNGLGDNIAVASFSTGLTSINANEITYTLGDDIAVANFLNLSPIYTQNRVWECRFKNKVDRQRITVIYSLSASNGQSGGISNGNNFFIPTAVRTKNLYFEKKDKLVVGDIEFELDLGALQATSSGNYDGVLTIEVYEN